MTGTMTLKKKSKMTTNRPLMCRFRDRQKAKRMNKTLQEIQSQKERNDDDDSDSPSSILQRQDSFFLSFLLAAAAAVAAARSSFSSSSCFFSNVILEGFVLL